MSGYSVAQKQSAERRRYPECRRKSALTEYRNWNWAVCRYCGHRVDDLQALRRQRWPSELKAGED